MQQQKKISRVSAGFLQDTRSWILMPKQVEFSFSVDSLHFSEPVVIQNAVKAEEMDVEVKDFEKKITKTTARYVKVKASNYGRLPEWHPGHSLEGDAFIFVDEITVE